MIDVMIMDNVVIILLQTLACGNAYTHPTYLPGVYN